MKATLRRQVMWGMLIQTAVVVLGLLLLLFAFNLKERHEHPDLAEEEAREFIIILWTTAVCLPLAGLSAWGITRRRLKPLTDITGAVRTMRASESSGRLKVPETPEEIRELALGINEAFDRYERILVNLDRFCYDAAHQLKNPLGAMRLEGEVCLQQERSPESYRDTIGGLLEQTTHLAYVVDQLLTLARLDRDSAYSGSERIEINELLRRALKDASPAIESKAIVLETVIAPEAVIVYGTSNLLREALRNLLDNALKFTPEHSRIRIDLGRPNINTALIEIEDSGPGIPANVAERIFSPFDRGNPRVSGEGTGLGLAITATIVRLHRGSITVGQGRLPGACFQVRLPTA